MCGSIDTIYSEMIVNNASQQVCILSDVFITKVTPQPKLILHDKIGL